MEKLKNQIWYREVNWLKIKKTRRQKLVKNYILCYSKEETEFQM